MERLRALLEKFFTVLDDTQYRLSERWRVHSNRRTVLILVGVGAISIYFYLFIIRPPDNFPLNQLVTVPEGATLKETAKLLESEGVVRSPLAFRAIVTAIGYERSVHAGDYLFKEPKDVFVVARAISIGAFGLEPMRVRVPEGAMTKDIALIFNGRLQRFDKDRFLEKAQPMEGYLFPDTYFFLPNATEDTVIQAMRQNFDAHLDAPVIGTTTLAQMVEKSGMSLDEIVTLASIVEREAHNTNDRRIIAGVLLNRLKRGMPLQVDVTFLYTLGKGTFQLTMKDLTSDSPYNTYKNKGLPPTPIGSPSFDSLSAATNPIKNDYLFFLADHTGVTHFCKTYACQAANKELYF